MAVSAWAPAVLAQEPPPTEPVVTEPSQPAPTPDPPPARAPSPPRAQPKPTPRPVQRPAAPAPRRSTAPTPAPTPSSSRPAYVPPTRPSTRPPVRRATPTKQQPKRQAKRAKKRKRTTVEQTPDAGAVAGARASLPASQEPARTPPSNLAVTPDALSETGAGRPESISFVVMAMLILGFALALVAAIPTQQLVLIPGSHWIARRRLDLVVFGIGVIAAVLVVLLITELLGP